MSEVHASLARSHGDLARNAEKSPLARQTLRRELSDREVALADTLEEIYGEGISDFDVVAEQLTQRGIKAPHSLESKWTRDLLQAELQRINESLDAAYRGDSA